MRGLSSGCSSAGAEKLGSDALKVAMSLEHGGSKVGRRVRREETRAVLCVVGCAERAWTSKGVLNDIVEGGKDVVETEGGGVCSEGAEKVGAAKAGSEGIETSGGVQVGVVDDKEVMLREVVDGDQGPRDGVAEEAKVEQ